MQENKNEVLTAKSGVETDDAAPTVAPKKSRRALWIVLVVLGLCLAFGVGAVAGGGAVYGLTRARSRMLVQPSIRMWGPSWRREMPHQDLPMGPGLEWMGAQSGALIVEVVPDGPADKAGIEEGEVVLAVAGKALDEDHDLAALIGGYKPGDEVKLEVAGIGGRVAGDSREVTVVLGEHPETAGKAYLGVTFVPVPGGTPGSGGSFRFERYDDGSDEDGFRRQFEFSWPNRGS